MLPLRCDICNWVGSTSCHPGKQYSILYSHYIFHMCLHKQRSCFSDNLYKSWESLVTLQLPSDCCVVFWTNESEKQDTNTFCINLPKKERGSIYRNVTWQWPKNKKNLLVWKCHETMTKKFAYISNETQLQNISLAFIHKNKSLLSSTSILFRSPMASNTTASLDKLTCIDYVGFGKCQGRFGHFSWSKTHSNYLVVKFKVFKKDDNRDYRLVQNLTMRESIVNQFLRLRSQQVIATDNFGGEQILPYIQLPAISKNLDEQLKVFHKMVDV